MPRRHCVMLLRKYQPHKHVAKRQQCYLCGFEWISYWEKPNILQFHRRAVNTILIAYKEEHWFQADEDQLFLVSLYTLNIWLPMLIYSNRSFEHFTNLYSPMRTFLFTWKNNNVRYLISCGIAVVDICLVCYFPSVIERMLVEKFVSSDVIGWWISNWIFQ